MHGGDINVCSRALKSLFDKWIFRSSVFAIVSLFKILWFPHRPQKKRNSCKQSLCFFLETPGWSSIQPCISAIFLCPQCRLLNHVLFTTKSKDLLMAWSFVQSIHAYWFTNNTTWGHQNHHCDVISRKQHVSNKTKPWLFRLYNIYIYRGLYYQSYGEYNEPLQGSLLNNQ